MKLRNFTAPHIKAVDSNRTMMGDVIISLLALYFMAVWNYGMRAVMLCAISVATAYIADFICIFIDGRRFNIRDYSSVVTGMLLPLMMPASIDYYIVVAAALFAIVVAKQPFGGIGQNIFNPAAAGFAFIAICWPQKLFLYPLPLDRLETISKVTTKLVQSPIGTIKLGGKPNFGIIEMLLGGVPGPMGATNFILIAACMLFLVFRKTISWQLPVSFMSTVALFALIFPREPLNPSQSLLFELTGGMMFFSAVFVLTDPVTSPKRRSSMALYGVVAAIISMLYRHFGGFEEGVMFALIFANSLGPIIDRLNETFRYKFIRGSGFEIISGKKIL